MITAKHMVLMGVCGCGKSLIGNTLSTRIGWPFIEGDAYHSQDNIAKMQRGEALTRDDRIPWLLRLNEELIGYEKIDAPVILACSALTNEYRHILATNLRTLPRFVYLKVSPQTAKDRLANRNEHFMPSSLVESQFQILEEPDHEEALILDGNKKPESILRQIIIDLI